MLEDGKPIPEPRDPNYSGRVLLRMPATLHAELARQAVREGVSLNTFLTTALAGAVGWKNASDGGFITTNASGGTGRKIDSRSTVSSSNTRRKTTRRRTARSSRRHVA